MLNINILAVHLPDVPENKTIHHLKPFGQVNATRSSGPNGSLDGWNTIAWFGRFGFVFGCWVLGHWDDLSAKVGGLYFQSPVLHGSVFRWPGCSSRISHTVCHLAFKLKINLEDFWENYPEISWNFLPGLYFVSRIFTQNAPICKITFSLILFLESLDPRGHGTSFWPAILVVTDPSCTTWWPWPWEENIVGTKCCMTLSHTMPHQILRGHNLAATCR